MHRFRALPILTAGLVALAACADDAASPSHPTGALSSAASTCTGDVAGIIEAIAPAPGLENAWLSRCANIQRQYQRGKVVDATGMVFDLIEDALAEAAMGNLVDPPPPPFTSLEEALEALILALLAEVDLADTNDPSSADAGVVVLDEAGGTEVSESEHLAFVVDPGDLAGETFFAYFLIPGPFSAGACPFSFPVDHDCYALFYDLSVTPASNVINPIHYETCVDDSHPFAPTETVAARLRIASEDPANPGNLIFWPLEGTNLVDCSDLAFNDIGWQGDLFDLLGPLARLFEVTPAWAHPGGLGASISSFSPFAPADPVPRNQLLVDCPNGQLGDVLSRGFYHPSWPGSSLGEVQLFFGTNTAGTYEISLTARLDTYDGALIGTDTVSIALPGGLVETPATFEYPNPAVTPGETVTFALEQVSGPEADVFYAVPGELPTGDPNCPIVQTNDTNPPLDTLRRQGVKARIFGTE